MSAVHPCARFHLLRAELDEVMADADRWSELPRLLDELDQTRRDGHVSLLEPRRRAVWVDRFADALAEAHGAPDRSEHVRRTAQDLWHWLGTHDPVAIARCRWDALPRSYN